MAELPPMWLLEKHGTLEKALLDADLAVVAQETAVGTAHKAVRAALERQQEAVQEFHRLDAEYMAAYDRLQRIREHRNWVESLCCEAGRRGASE